MRRFYGFDFKGKSDWRFKENSSWMRLIQKWLSMVKKTAADSKTKGKKPGDMQPAWLMSVREWLLEFLSETTQFINMLWH